MKRKEFIQQLMTLTAGLVLPATQLQFCTDSFSGEDLSFGIVADVHQDLIPDGMKRLERFMLEAEKRNLDFILQLGDFCMASEKNKAFLNLWNAYENPTYHVLGNHDMDLQSKSEIMDYWGMPKSYYSFQNKGIRFIILDANFLYQDGQFVDYEKSNFYVDDQFRTFIDPTQIEWLSDQLESSNMPTIIFSHQSLWHYQWGVKNRLEIQQLLEKHQDQIICCMNGHNHQDYHHQQNGIDYIEINSMSYYWVGEAYQTIRYSEELRKEYKWLDHIAPYQDPLYAFVRIQSSGTITIEGVRSQWVPPSPFEAGMPEQMVGMALKAQISDYQIQWKT